LRRSLYGTSEQSDASFMFAGLKQRNSEQVEDMRIVAVFSMHSFAKAPRLLELPCANSIAQGAEPGITA
jgi:hypothetical protein